MRKEIDDQELKSRFVLATESVKPDPALWERIHQSTRGLDRQPGTARGKSRMRPLAAAAAAALAAVLLTGLTPGGKAAASHFAQKLGLQVFSVTKEKGEQIRRDGVKIEVDRLEGPVKVNGLELSPANPDAPSARSSDSGAVLEERDSSGAVLERTINTKKVRSLDSDSIHLE